MLFTKLLVFLHVIYYYVIDFLVCDLLCYWSPWMWITVLLSTWVLFIMVLVFLNAVYHVIGLLDCDEVCYWSPWMWFIIFVYLNMMYCVNGLLEFDVLYLCLSPSLWFTVLLVSLYTSNLTYITCNLHNCDLHNLQLTWPVTFITCSLHNLWLITCVLHNLQLT